MRDIKRERDISGDRSKKRKVVCGEQAPSLSGLPPRRGRPGPDSAWGADPNKNFRDWAWLKICRPSQKHALGARRRPAIPGRQQPYQSQLRAGGVPGIHPIVCAAAIIQTQAEIGGASAVPKARSAANETAGKSPRPARGKLVQFGPGQHQHLRHFPYSRPLLVACRPDRQSPNLRQNLPERRRLLRNSCSRSIIALVAPVGGTLILGEPLAELSSAVSQQPGHAAAPPGEVGRLGEQRRRGFDPSANSGRSFLKRAAWRRERLRQHREFFVAENITRRRSTRRISSRKSSSRCSRTVLSCASSSALAACSRPPAAAASGRGAAACRRSAS